jgi:hypothetical protein
MPSNCGTKKMMSGGKVENASKKMRKPAKKAGGMQKPTKQAGGTKIRGTGAATKGTMARGPMG